MKKVLYHGTNGDFDSFDFSRCGSATEDMSSTGALGAWFTDKYEYAECYASNVDGSTIYAAIVDTGCFDNTWEQEGLETLVEENGAEDSRAMIEAEGHNGIVSYTCQGAEYCAFSVESIERMWTVDSPLSEDEIAEIED